MTLKEIFAMEMKTESQLIKTVTNWAQGRDVLASFIAMHPELGMRYTENVYNNFVRIHGPALLRMDVMRKANLRAPAIMNLEKFDTTIKVRICTLFSQKKF
jgi:hypothetical protein